MLQMRNKRTVARHTRVMTLACSIDTDKNTQTMESLTPQWEDQCKYVANNDYNVNNMF